MLGINSDILVADVRPPTWHTYIALEPDTWIFEVKLGPFDPATDKEWPPWAPVEGTPEADDYLVWLRSCISGE
jgi:cupin fold WbuC family metalloprotein